MNTLAAAVPADFEEVQRLLESNELPAEDIAAHFDHFIVARAMGRLVGVAGLEPHGTAALLRSVCVAEHARGQGLGHGLCDEIEAMAGRLGVLNLYLLTTTAQRFFEARRFALIDRAEAPEVIRATAEFRLLFPASAVCMHKRLGSRDWASAPPVIETADPSAPAPPS